MLESPCVRANQDFCSLLPSLGAGVSVLTHLSITLRSSWRLSLKVLLSPAAKDGDWHELPKVIRSPMAPSSIILVRPNREATHVFLKEVERC
ncbi:hypothetical protein CY34DRAFT_799188 [Suillus luteus UH-Slu-Lm8-n1]|uniref:Uncharacterized protein n=1 Tax=Suillus luteus UH-Slu-Lm8-n1 TaxID=930992 RepID=A0A0D0B0I0_9AGAM|nr:hypothetical protein CY34DRAFT_799188 [Suillus luteus UH-Slu-Lm8-n1]